MHAEHRVSEAEAHGRFSTPVRGGRWHVARLCALIALLLLPQFSGAAQQETMNADTAAAGATRNAASAQRARAMIDSATRCLSAGRMRDAEALIDSARIICAASSDSGMLGRVELTAGEILRRQSRNAEAAVHFDLALRVMTAAGDSAGIAWVHRRLGDLCSLRDDERCAHAQYREALARFTACGDVRGKAGVLTAIGKLLLGRGAHDEADSLFRAALALSTTAHDAFGIGDACLSLAQLHLSRDQMQDADSCLQRARIAFRAANDILGRANTTLLLGEIARATGRLDRADSLLREADAAYLAAGALFNHCHVADLLGSVAWLRDDPAMARTWLEESVSCHERVGNPRGAAYARLTLAEVASMQCFFEEAQDKLGEALRCFTRLRDPLGRGNVLKALAELEIVAGRVPEAESYLRLALEALRQAGNPLGQANASLALAKLAQQGGRLEEADSLCRAALLFYHVGGTISGIAEAHLILGDGAAARGDIAEARNQLDSARVAYEAAGQPHGLAQCWMNEFVLHWRGRDWESAAVCLDSAAALFAGSGDLWSLSQVQQRRGRVEAVRGRSAAAKEAYLEAVRLRELLRGNLAEEETRRSYLAGIADVYQETAGFLLSAGYSDDAWRTMEQMRARVFAEQLASRFSGVEQHADAALARLRDALRERRGALEMLRERARSQEARDSLLREMLRCDSAEAAIRAEIRAVSPAYASLVDAEPVSLDHLQRNVLRPGEALVEYLLLDSAVWAFLVRTDTVRVAALPIGRAGIVAALERRAAAYRVVARLGNAPDDADSSGIGLYRALLEPLLPSLRDSTRLIIVPDGELALLSFEGLETGRRTVFQRDEYVIDRFTVTCAQSASVLSLLRSRPVRERSPRLLAFGDPLYENAAAHERGSNVPTADLRLRRLQYSGNEVAAVAALFPAERALTFTREHATEEAVKGRDWRDRTHILFSCHGKAGRSYNWLALSQNLPDAKDDGLLHWQEVMNCRFDADLIILSACETALGVRERGEGVTGLMRAMQYAGSRAVTGTLWSVNDPATTELVVAFFRCMLRDGLPAPLALRAAKREFLSRRDAWSHPYFWSAFVFYGD